MYIYVCMCMKGEGGGGGGRGRGRGRGGIFVPGWLNISFQQYYIIIIDKHDILFQSFLIINQESQYDNNNPSNISFIAISKLHVYDYTTQLA